MSAPFYLLSNSFSLSLIKIEDKLHLCKKNEQVHVILLSVCIIFAEYTIHLEV